MRKFFRSSNWTNEVEKNPRLDNQNGPDIKLRWTYFVSIRVAEFTSKSREVSGGDLEFGKIICAPLIVFSFIHVPTSPLKIAIFN